MRAHGRFHAVDTVLFMQSISSGASRTCAHVHTRASLLPRSPSLLQVLQCFGHACQGVSTHWDGAELVFFAWEVLTPTRSRSAPLARECMRVQSNATRSLPRGDGAAITACRRRCSGAPPGGQLPGLSCGPAGPAAICGYSCRPPSCPSPLRTLGKDLRSLNDSTYQSRTCGRNNRRQQAHLLPALFSELAPSLLPPAGTQQLLLCLRARCRHRRRVPMLLLLVRCGRRPAFSCFASRFQPTKELQALEVLQLPTQSAPPALRLAACPARTAQPGQASPGGSAEQLAPGRGGGGTKARRRGERKYQAHGRGVQSCGGGAQSCGWAGGGKVRALSTCGLAERP